MAGLNRPPPLALGSWIVVRKKFLLKKFDPLPLPPGESPDRRPARLGHVLAADDAGDRHPPQPDVALRRDSSRPPFKDCDVDEEVVAPGRIASTQSTEIRCTLEKLDSAAAGGSLVNGASTILSLVPEGSMVKKGDILCELDSSAYQELVRRQKITVEQVKAEHQQAVLALDVAKLALEAYLEGERIQVGQDYKGQIALATADLSRQTDRLEWVRRMLEKGYSSAAQVASEKQSALRLTLSLRSMERALANYEHFTEPKEVLSLRSDVVGAEATLGYQTTRLNREQDRLEHYEKLLNSCTIRAPNDGYVVYANNRRREPEVYEGARYASE